MSLRVCVCVQGWGLCVWVMGLEVGKTELNSDAHPAMGDLEDPSGCLSHRLCEKWGGMKFSEQGVPLLVAWAFRFLCSREECRETTQVQAGHS